MNEENTLPAIPSKAGALRLRRPLTTAAVLPLCPALVYFDKDWSALTRREFLALVALIVATNDLDPAWHGVANAARVRRIERLLRGDCRPVNLWDVYYRRCD